MSDHQCVVALKSRIHEGLIKEAVRRLMVLPQYGAAEPEAVRTLVEAEVEKGNITLFGVLRSVKKII